MPHHRYHHNADYSVQLTYNLQTALILLLLVVVVAAATTIMTTTAIVFCPITITKIKT